MELEQLRAEINAVKAFPWKRWLVSALIGLGVLAAALMIYNHHKPVPKIVAVPQVAAEAPKAVNVEKIYIPGPKKLQVYNKEDLLKKIPTTPAMAADSSIQFTSTAEIQKSPYGGTAKGFTNLSTGKSGIEFTPKERPWFEFGGKTTVGALGGVSTKGNVAIGYIGQDIVRLWGVSVGVAGGGGIIGTDGLVGGVIHLHSEF